ncbi:hypothetical protein [Candidatus Enterococcus testudinis]|nr:hypothetical protein [Enterococcus sp. 8G7_MSG3316]
MILLSGCSENGQNDNEGQVQLNQTNEELEGNAEMITDSSIIIEHTETKVLEEGAENVHIEQLDEE